MFHKQEQAECWCEERKVTSCVEVKIRRVLQSEMSANSLSCSIGVYLITSHLSFSIDSSILMGIFVHCTNTKYALLACMLFDFYNFLITRLLRGVGRWARKPVNHTSWVAVVTPTDRPKSVRNCCLIELFCGVVCVVTLSLWHFCWYRGFCHRTGSDLLLFVFISYISSVMVKCISYSQQGFETWPAIVINDIYTSTISINTIFISMQLLLWELLKYKFHRLHLDYKMAKYRTCSDRL